MSRRMFFKSHKAARNELEKMRSLFTGFESEINATLIGVGLSWSGNKKETYNSYKHTLDIRTKFGNLERTVYASIPTRGWYGPEIRRVDVLDKQGEK